MIAELHRILLAEDSANDAELALTALKQSGLVPPRTSPRRQRALDARVAWHARQDLELSGVGQSLLQGHHREFGHDPGPPVAIRRGVYASIVWHRR